MYFFGQNDNNNSFNSDEIQRLRKIPRIINETYDLPFGKYNPWCHRRPLTSNNKDKTFSALRIRGNTSLPPYMRVALFIHELTGCKGLEFVVFSNLELLNPIIFSKKVYLVPCFLSNEDKGPDWLINATRDMHSRERFIYDGWISISDWNKESIDDAIEIIDRAFLVLQLQTRVKIVWKPKYFPSQATTKKIHIDSEYQQELTRLNTFIANLKLEEDKQAITRSLSWYSQAVNLTDPISAFLFSFLAIESLVTYIEKSSKEDSAFFQLRKTKSLTTEERENCIDGILDNNYRSNPSSAISKAYFDCVISISKQLKIQIQSIFGENSDQYKLLFTKEIQNKSLYNWRHEIAHGSAKIWSESIKHEITDQVPRIKKIAEEFLVHILQKIQGEPIFQKITKEIGRLSPSIGDFISSNENMWKGPTNLALYH